MVWPSLFPGPAWSFSTAAPPSGWALCDGSILPIVGNDTLFAAIGNTYGGDGVNNFALPDFRSRTLVHTQDPTILQGTSGGLETVTLQETQLPSHSHDAGCTATLYSTSSPQGQVFANAGSLPAFPPYGLGTAGIGSVDSSLAPGSVANSGGGQAHDNRQPYMALYYLICTAGVLA